MKLTWFHRVQPSVAAQPDAEKEPLMADDLRRIWLRVWEDAAQTQTSVGLETILPKTEVVPFLIRLLQTYLTAPETKLGWRELGMLCSVSVHKLAPDKAALFSNARLNWKWIDFQDPADQAEADEHGVYFYHFTPEVAKRWLAEKGIEAPALSQRWISPSITE